MGRNQSAWLGHYFYYTVCESVFVFAFVAGSNNKFTRIREGKEYYQHKRELNALHKNHIKNRYVNKSLTIVFCLYRPE